MSREIEEFMDNEDAYNVLRHACYWDLQEAVCI